MNDGAQRYAVILKNAEDLEPQRLAPPLSRALKIALYDAARQSRMHRGIPAKNLDEGAAKSIASEFEASGIDCAVVREESIASMPEARKVPKLEMMEDGLIVFPLDGREELKWDEIALIAAATTENRETKTTVSQISPGMGKKIAGFGILMTTGIPLKMGKTRKVEKTETTTKLEYFAELFAGNPPRRFRIDAESFDFTCLKEKIFPNIYSNFTLLVTELVKMAPRALLNRGVRNFLKPGEGERFSYTDNEDFNAENRWLLTLRNI
ncbi:MAG: hypothetical protein CVU78_07910 [Elusimicrobia bacterium HGW-Elusimicrobia-2]|nr:MAG: hypothetical protein CVU78_07910 [Elusimicrobia bacterium HGW-Elusimicrobia-2]